MTRQANELLRYRGRTYALLDTPLDSCDYEGARGRMQLLQMSSTALWRGYRGTWEVKRGRLWLVELPATIREYTSGTNWHHADRDLSWLFPDAEGPVLADWFTGELVSPRGKAERTGQFAVDWPYYRVFHVKRGVIASTELRDNRVKLREGRRKQKRWEELLATF